MIAACFHLRGIDKNWDSDDNVSYKFTPLLLNVKGMLADLVSDRLPKRNAAASSSGRTDQTETRAVSSNEGEGQVDALALCDGEKTEEPERILTHEEAMRYSNAALGLKVKSIISNKAPAKVCQTTWREEIVRLSNAGFPAINADAYKTLRLEIGATQEEVTI